MEPLARTAGCNTSGCQSRFLVYCSEGDDTGSLSSGIMGTELEGKNVCFNSAVVDVLKAKYGRDFMLAHLLRCLCLFAARHTFWFWAKHVPGSWKIQKQNDLFLWIIPPGNSKSLYTSNRRSAGTAVPASGNLDVASLDRAVHRYFSEVLAASTKTSYASAPEEISLVLQPG